MRPGFFHTAICFLIFFISGAAALIYEISWSRQIGLLFGHTVHAAAVVLASYFAGMAIGQLIGARLASRVTPLRGYGFAELAVAAWACLIPWLLKLSETPAVAAWLSDPSFAWQTSARTVFCFLLFLPATTALGATLPMMAQMLATDRSNVSSAGRVSFAYALNTAGALAGVMIATFYLLVTIGVRNSSYLAAALSAVCGIAAIVLARTSNSESGSATYGDRTGSALAAEVPQSEQHGLSLRFCLFLAAISGFGTLALEVLYVRTFSLVFHNSTYTFGAVLAVFLFSLALGAAVAGWLGRWFQARTLIAGATLVGSIAVPLSVLVFVERTSLDYFVYGNSFSSYLYGAFGLVALIVIPPVTLLGAILPLVWKAAGLADDGAGKTVGRLTAANTTAAALGSLAASFLFLPFVDLWPSFVALAFAFFVAGSWVLLSPQFILRSSKGATSGSKLRLPAALICGTLFLLIAFAALRSPVQSKWGHEKEKILQRWHSPYGWVDVVQNRNSGAMKVSQNLHYRFGSTGSSSARENLQAHLPLLMHDSPRETLFLGLGTGMTAAGAVPHREVEAITIVELIPEVVDATRMLSCSNNNIVDHTKTKIVVDDARHLLLGSEKRYDVIVSDLFVPWESETGYLYTVENYRLARRRLTDGGIFCQWLALYQMGPGEFELIADSFASVFPNTTLWWGQLTPDMPIVALIGSEQPLRLDSNKLRSRIDALRLEPGQETDSSVQPTPLDRRIVSPESLFKLYVGDWKVRHADWLNTDEYPRVEFLTPVSHRDRELIKNVTLSRYFDNVIAGLDSRGAALDDLPNGKTRDRIQWQRIVLFGE